jgi:hypothetical protein
VSARSFTVPLLRPAVEIVVVVHRLVSGRSVETPDQPVGGVVADRKQASLGMAAQVLIDRLAHDAGQRRPAATRLELQLAVGPLGEAQVRGHQLRHRYRDIAVPRRCRTRPRRSPTAPPTGRSARRPRGVALEQALWSACGDAPARRISRSKVHAASRQDIREPSPRGLVKHHFTAPEQRHKIPGSDSQLPAQGIGGAVQQGRNREDRS